MCPCKAINCNVLTCSVLAEKSLSPRPHRPRLASPCNVLTWRGFLCHYSRTFACAAMTPDKRSSALTPCRSLQAGRSKLSGSANWDPFDYIEDSLLLAFRNSPELPFVPEPGPQDVPLGHSGRPSELLIEGCAAVGLHGPSFVSLRRAPKLRPFEAVRLFHALNGSSTDPQIADRRGAACPGWVPTCGLDLGPLRSWEDGVVDEGRAAPKRRSECLG